MWCGYHGVCASLSVGEEVGKVGGVKGCGEIRGLRPSPCPRGLAPSLLEPLSCDSPQLVHLLEELIKGISSVMDTLVADEGRESALALLNICSHLFR